MNYTEAKNIDIVTFLSKKGIQPITIKGYQYGYKSPLREESKASFYVDSTKNVWYDFGIGEGGDIILLVERMYNTKRDEAFKIVCENNHIVFESKRNPAIIQNQFKKFEIAKTFDEIKSYYLISYLHSRCINYQLVKHSNCIHEVEFVAQSGKLISALGFKNDHGGYEIRNAFTKLSTSPKMISTIHGDESVLNVFEGFMDYLSAITYYDVKVLNGTTVILNGVGQKRHLMKILTNYDKIIFYGDNDPTGVNLVKDVSSKHSNVVNLAEKLYPKFKDFNDFLCEESRNKA